MWLIILIIVLILLSSCMVLIELFSPRIKEYALVETRIDKPLRLMMISDLHGRKSFSKNKHFFEKIKNKNPDGFLLGGDMITTRSTNNYKYAYEFIKKISEIAPVYYAIGNHEARCMTKKSPYYQLFMSYLNQVKQLNHVYVLDNELSTDILPVAIYGFTVDISNYEKKQNQFINTKKFWSNLPSKINTMPVILIAHNPKFMNEYFNWGADYVLSGHYHGGMVRIPFVGGIISPDLKLFPQYSGGRYKHGQQNGFVTRGIGTHTIHFRLFNRCEVIQLDLTPERI